MWYVYVLLCEDSSFYTGIAKNVQTRFQVHLKGRGATYTRIHKPVRILYSEKVELIADAMKRERQIKAWPRARKIKNLRLEKLLDYPINLGVDHIGVCVVFYCHDGKGNFLLAKRSKKSRDEHGRWDPGGGGVDFGEPVMKALKREIKEEYGATVIEADFLGYRDVHRKDEKGQKTHWIALDYRVLIDPSKVKNRIPDKHEELEWFTLDNLPTPMHSQWSEFERLYRAELEK